MTQTKNMPHSIGAFLKGVGVDSVELDANNHLIVHLDNGEKVDAGEFKVDDELNPNSSRPLANKAITSLFIQVNERISKLVGENATEAIDNLNEIIAFLQGFKDSETLASTLVEINEELQKKVDKENGKGLSTNDYSDEEMEQVERVRNGSVVVDNTLSALDETSNKPVGSKAVAPIVKGVEQNNENIKAISLSLGNPLLSEVSDWSKGYILASVGDTTSFNVVLDPAFVHIKVSVKAGESYKVDIESNDWGGPKFLITNTEGLVTEAVVMRNSPQTIQVNIVEDGYLVVNAAQSYEHHLYEPVTFDERIRVLETSVDTPIAKDNTTFFTDVSRNLFNGDTEVGFIDSSTGEVGDNSTYRVSGYIPVKSSIKYTVFYWFQVGCYRNDKTFIKRIDIASPFISAVSLPDDCAFVRLSTQLTRTDQMLVEGEHLQLRYEPYSNTMPQANITQRVYKANTFFADMITGYWQAPEQESFNPAQIDRNVSDIYNIYDALQEANPEYITKENMGKDSSGLYDIYRYTFKPTYPIMPEGLVHLPKVILIAGVHGLERWSIYAISQLMKAVCESDDPMMQYLRYNVEFVIIPLAVPWAYIQGTRWNANGVNINRNFDIGWQAQYEPFENDYSGATPISEVETQYIRNTIDANTDAIACIDCHTHDITNWANAYWLVATRNDTYKEVLGITASTLKSISRTMKAEYNLPSGEWLGYIEYNEPHSTVTAYSGYMGILGCTGECTNKFPDETESGSKRVNRCNVEFYANLICSFIKHCQR